MTQPNKINTRKEILKRAYVIFILVGSFCAFLIYSMIKLQNGFDKEFSIELKKKNTRIRDVAGIRGNIYADDGSLLATSIPTYDLIWDANADGLTTKIFNAKLDSLSMMFARVFPEKSKSTWKSKFTSLKNKKLRYTIIGKDLGFDIVRNIKTFPLIWSGKFKSGFWFEEKGKRMYFMGDLAKRAIGYTKNGVNVGLEGSFDSLLRGRNGKIMEQRMPGRIWRPVNVGNNQLAENGFDIVTTLDVGFQDITQYALSQALITNEADHGCAMVMEVKTGAIKAIANLKRGTDGKYYESQNYAVSEFSEPGSTFKLISVLSLLEDEYAKPNDSIALHNGSVKYYDKTFTDGDHFDSRNKFYTLQESFEKSSNVGISQFVWKYYQKKPQKFIDHIIELGLNAKPNFDIPSSNYPVIKTTKSSDWNGVTLPSMSIGYTSQISPLQTLMLYNSVANGGKMMNPYLVKEILQDGKSVSKIEPKVINEKICSPQTLVSLQQLLKGVVERGTAEEITKKCPFTAAGKTGTVRISENGKYIDKHMASFVGYFPAEDPQYTIIVIINKPNKEEYYGAKVAVPVFIDIANKIYSSHIKTQPTLVTARIAEAPSVLNGNQYALKSVLNELSINSRSSMPAAQYCEANAKGYTININAATIEPNKVPDFRGMGLRDALQLAKKIPVKITFEGYGKVVSQSFNKGTTVSPNNSIHLKLSPSK